ncbi:PRLR protein, partial [Phaetusa simplex]|nr:PRLR protein [Phaetusa simplex]
SEEEIYECPDYRTSGPNSCYFDTNHTTPWTTYNITVTATNEIGSNSSDPQYVDVTSIGKKGRMKWRTNYDTSLLLYGLFVKMAQFFIIFPVHFLFQTISVGVQTQYKVIRLQAGVKYVVQVRCMLDLGEWSEWSSERRIQIPNGESPPEKPTIIKCRSPEKETFTCWWKPGSDGGHPTNYTLLYSKEGEEQVYECPDYRTAGPNSCYFDKKHTSFWTIYNITVRATNEMGNNFSDPHYVDVTYIVPPTPSFLSAFSSPISVSCILLLRSPLQFPPYCSSFLFAMMCFCNSLICTVYRSHISFPWNYTIFVGQQTQYKMFSLNPGKKYIVQIHCKPDHHGSWSEWSSEKYIQIPTGEWPGIPSVIVIHVVILWGPYFYLVCLLVFFRMIAFILPPVPGPKIKGIDTHLLETGKSEELLSALGCHGFPPTSDCEELLIEYLEVEDSEDQQLMPSHDSGHPSKNTKMIPKETDSDSGRGSCDSPSLLSEKCRECHTLPSTLQTQDIRDVQENTGGKTSWETQHIASEQKILLFNNETTKSSTWPAAQLPNTQPPMFAYHSTVDAYKITLNTANVNIAPVLVGNEEKRQSQYPITETVHNDIEKQREMENLHSKTDKTTAQVKQNRPNDKTLFLNPKVMDYVEVHKVRQDEQAVLLKHKENSGKTEKYTVPGTSKEYTKVSTVVDHNIIVLMPDSCIQHTSVSQEPAMEASPNLQQGQAEKNMSYCLTAPSECKRETSGSEYMDPSSFMPSFK